jgi:hypothetical protein
MVGKDGQNRASDQIADTCANIRRHRHCRIHDSACGVFPISPESLRQPPNADAADYHAKEVARWHIEFLRRLRKVAGFA